MEQKHRSHLTIGVSMLDIQCDFYNRAAFEASLSRVAHYRRSTILLSKWECSSIIYSLSLIDIFYFFRKFPIVLESDHVVASNQVLAAIIRNGPQKASLNGSFNNRYD